ncbi:putative RNA methyltransferase [Morchella snyderi]|nr:putative RNA methyltransferase [Morchella snyderi]
MAAPVSKKRRTSASPAPAASSQQGRAYTLSIAVPSTLLATAPNPILKTHLAGHLARISALHNIDEIVLYNPAPPTTTTTTPKEEEEDDQLPHILAYLATAPYLRKRLFPPHRHLRHVGLLPPLSLSTHPRPGAPAPFRPALAIPAPTPTPAGTVTLDAGLPAPVVAAADVAVGATVLLRMAGAAGGAAEVVARHTPREEHGVYSGYEVRRAAGLAAVFTECGWEGGYDLSVGVACGDGGGVALDAAVGGGAVPAFRHLLVAVGDLEGAARADAAGLAGVGARELFDLWVDPVPGCGCGGVSAEEALFAALAGLRRVVLEKGVR